MKEALKRMEEVLRPKEAGEGIQNEEALHPMQAEQGQEKEEDLHRTQAEKNLQVEETLALHQIEAEQGLQMEQTLHPMEAEVGLQMEETLAPHWIEAEQGLQMEESTLIHLLEAVVETVEAVLKGEKAETSRMREEKTEMEAALEAKENELEFLKTNRDRCVSEQLLLQNAEQVLYDILFPPN